MWLKLTKVKSGGEVRTYAQLVESYWDEGRPRHRVLASLGRVDELDPDMVIRLMRSFARLVDQVAVVTGPEDVRSGVGRAYGSTYALERLWDLIGLRKLWQGACEKRRFRFDLEAAVKAMVLSRLHDPGSELHTMDWLGRAHVTGAEGLELQHLYRALDAFHDLWPEMEMRLLPALAGLVAVDASICLFDTTSVYFEGEGPEGLARYGYSRDRRPDRKQFVLGLFTTKEGLPFGHVVYPGNTTDIEALSLSIDDVVRGMPVVSPVIVLDRGMVSRENLEKLRSGNLRYIVGVRLRQHKAREVLSRAGRYHRAAGNLLVKEVSCEGKERIIVCHNPEEAVRDREKREQMVEYLRRSIGSGVPKRLFRSGAARRYLKVTGGSVELDEERIVSDARYDGKWVLETNVPKEALSAREVALHYKNLWRVERAFRSLKSPLEVHPVYHWTEPRVKAHVGICVLAYTMLRLVELLLEKAGIALSGEAAIKELAGVTRQEIQAGPLHFWVRSECTRTQEAILQALRAPLPPMGGRLDNPSGKAKAARG